MIGMRYVPGISALIHMRYANVDLLHITRDDVRHVLRNARIALLCSLGSVSDLFA